MALKPCPRCGKLISDKAERCPKCGLDVRNFSSPGNSQGTQNIRSSSIIEKTAINNSFTQLPINEMSFQHTLPINKEGSFYVGNQSYIEPPKKSKTGLWICVSIILAVGIGAAIWIPVHLHNEKLKAKQLALLEQHRLASIAMAEAEGVRQKISQKSPNNDELNIQSPRVNNNPYFLDEQTAINFITNYHEAIKLGKADSFFEEDNIDFFNLKHVDKKEILKHLEKSTKIKSKHEYDWKTLKIYSLSDGEYRITFASKYYIFYDSKTDIYRLVSELILSPNKKIRSIKDLETIKVESEITPQEAIGT